MFADDSNFIISGKELPTLVEDLNRELTKVSEYFRANKLKLNAKKQKLYASRKRTAKLTLMTTLSSWMAKHLKLKKKLYSWE